jgi:hypothetical protein
VVWVSSADEAINYEAGRFALEHRAAVVLRATELPEHLAERLPGDVLILAVPDAESDSEGRVVFVGRPAGNPFTTTEIARIEALAALHGRMARLMAVTTHGSSA